jgi:hypothetical protein
MKEKARFEAERAVYKEAKENTARKVLELARESRADESEASFVAKVKAISSTKPRENKSRPPKERKK